MKKRQLRVVNPADGEAVKIPIKTIAITSALASVAGYLSVELIKYMVGRMKDKSSEKKKNPMAQLPGAVAPGMMPHPYGAMGGGFAPQLPNPFNIESPAASSEPPPWFMQFKEQYEDQIAALTEAVQTKKSVPRKSKKKQPNPEVEDEG